MLAPSSPAIHGWPQSPKPSLQFPATNARLTQLSPEILLLAAPGPFRSLNSLSKVFATLQGRPVTDDTHKAKLRYHSEETAAPQLLQASPRTLQHVLRIALDPGTMTEAGLPHRCPPATASRRRRQGDARDTGLAPLPEELAKSVGGWKSTAPGPSGLYHWSCGPVHKRAGRF